MLQRFQLLGRDQRFRQQHIELLAQHFPRQLGDARVLVHGLQALNF